MKMHNISRLFKASIGAAVTVIAVVETAMTVTGVSMGYFLPDWPWLLRLLLLLAVFAVCVSVAYGIIRCATKDGITMAVGGNSVKVEVGDIFKFGGKKVIPFNEYYDIEVDDVVISRKSLNGQFILNHVDDQAELRKAIELVEPTDLNPPVELNGRMKYELGSIKRFKDYFLLAFTHFNEWNESHLSMPDYERCLMNMWKELSRVHAGYPLALPLLGAGITRFDDVRQKSYDELLKCMICTLRATGFEFDGTITIVLTKDAAKKVNLFELKQAVSGKI